MGRLNVFVLSLTLIVAAHCKLHCHIAETDIPKDWITVPDDCAKAMSDQVQEELTAAMTYLAMGSHFSRDTINRPGFADFFFKAASEEREHAMKLLEYLLMRGELTQDVSKLIKDPKPIWTTWDSGIKALKDALNLETRVTKKIRDIIVKCESPAANTDGIIPNDYHLVDYLTGEFLTEQYEGQRELAGMVSTLGKMMDSHGALGEFLYDKKLLNKDIAV